MSVLSVQQSSASSPAALTSTLCQELYQGLVGPRSGIPAGAGWDYPRPGTCHGLTTATVTNITILSFILSLSLNLILTFIGDRLEV